MPTSERHVAFNQRRRFWLAILLLVLILASLRHLHSQFIQMQGRPSTTVVVATARSSDAPIYLPGLGTVTPTANVTVRTQINGQLQRVLFTQGQLVKAGDLLAEIDPRPYEAQLLQYQGQLERDSALLANAQVDLARYQLLWRQDSVAKQTLDTQASLVKQYEGTVKLDQALIQNTKLNLTYTRIVSPINGRIGLRLVDPGNYVQVSDTTGLAVITSLDPITVIFTLPEDDIQTVLKQMNLGKPLTAEVYNREQTQQLAVGTLLTIDNQIDPTTGTVKLRAQFPNKDLRLFPNQFVNVKLLVDVLHNVVLIPTAAIQYGAQGPFVYLLNAEKKKVHVVPIVTKDALKDETIIQSGVLAGQSVVVEGADKLTDDALVKIAPSSVTKAPARRIAK